MLVCSNVSTHLDYRNSILVNLPKSTLKPHQSIQNYAAKIICKRQNYDSSTECLYRLQWLPIHYRCMYKLVTIVYKTLNEGEPQYLADKHGYKTLDITTRYNTSNSKQLDVPFNRRTLFHGNKLLELINQLHQRRKELRQIQETPENTFFLLMDVSHSDYMM